MSAFFDVATPERQAAHTWLKSSPCREFGIIEAIVASGQGKIPHGGVVGMVTSSGKWGWYDPTATDGREEPLGLLYYDVDATTNDVAVACITRRVAINPLALSWHASVDTQAKKDAALAKLAALEILTRHTL